MVVRRHDERVTACQGSVWRSIQSRALKNQRRIPASCGAACEQRLPICLAPVSTDCQEGGASSVASLTTSRFLLRVCSRRSRSVRNSPQRRMSKAVNPSRMSTPHPQTAPRAMATHISITTAAVHHGTHGGYRRTEGGTCVAHPDTPPRPCGHAQEHGSAHMKSENCMP